MKLRIDLSACFESGWNAVRHVKPLSDPVTHTHIKNNFSSGGND